MKILIADDDSVCLTTLSTLLQKANHEAVPFKDGSTALEALLAPEPPPIAILDWMMPGLDGLQVCAKLRGANLRTRPYVIIQSVRGEKADVVAGLDSGADDYLPKPVNPAELLARLRVAERTIVHQRELKTQVEEMESLIQRYSLLGEIVVSHTTQPATGVTEFISKPTVGIPAELSDQRIQSIVSKTLAELGLGQTIAKLVVESGPYRANDYTAWAGFIMPRENVWVDLLLEASTGDLEKLCKKSLHRIGRGKEVPGVLAETHTILSAALRAALQTRAVHVIAPLLSRVRSTQPAERPLPPIPSRRSHIFSIGESSLGLTMVVSQCRPTRKDPKQMQPQEILAEPVFAPSTPGLPLFTEGAVLNTRHIERLAAIALDTGSALLISVYELSELANFFCR